MSRSEQSGIKLILETVGLTALAFIASLILGVIFVVGAILGGYGIGSTFTLAGSTIIGQVGFLLVAFFYIKYRDVKVPFELPSKSNLLYIVGGIGLTLLTALGLLQIQSMLGLMSESVIEDAARGNPMIILVLAILSITLIAPSEELLFRGAIQGRLHEHFGSYPSIITASLLFGSLHLLNFSGSIIPTVFSAFIIVVTGSILGWLYERTENLAVPITVHAIYNFILLVPSYFAMV